ncbi:MAG: PEP-CTERM sorting domain-containing protein [Rhodospirillales bacterium]|nr:PEP-CTERM sorting domain-containing protein [Rhodospirillales bacterium]
MNKPIAPVVALFAAIPFATCPSPVSAATLFTNTGGLVTVAGNWNSGLPTGGSTGTININASADSNLSTISGYDVVHTGGVFSHTGLNAVPLTGGTTWLINGASASTNTSFRGFKVEGGSAFTLQSGTVNTASGRDWPIVGTGASITINGGSANFGRSIVMQGTAGSVFTINAGSANGTGSIGGNNIQDNLITVNFNGGTTTFGNLDLRGDNTFFVFGGITVGTLSATTINSGGTFGTNSNLNFLSGTGMSLTVTGADQAFYEGLYTSNRLRFNGSNAAAFSTNFQVSGSTLSLVIPEPASLALAGLGGLLILRRGRRHE